MIFRLFCLQLEKVAPLIMRAKLQPKKLIWQGNR